MAPLLTPGLTPLQKQRLADAIRRIGGVPLGSITTAYLDADVAAARALDYKTDSPTPAAAVAAGIAAEHKLSPHVAACVYGIAVGVRLGRSFAPEPRRRAKAWISDEYKQLTEHNRRDAAKYIRTLLKAQGGPRHLGRTYAVMTGQAPAERIDQPSASPDEELAAAKRWARDMGHVASGAQRRNKRTTDA